ncbi:MAG: endonuclease Q family protein [Acidobacteriota bacterium]
MRQYYADLHVHVGRAQGRPVKITASEKLTVESILDTCAGDKGLDIVGIVDCGSPPVLQDIKELLSQGKLEDTGYGFLRSERGVNLVLGIETESREGAHFISYMPDLEALDLWHKTMNRKLTNPNLSTQRSQAGAVELLDKTLALDGIFVVAHAFTPHKGAYGCWVERLQNGFGNKAMMIHALELGLSSDTDMAGLIQETSGFAFLSNSDAHSGPNIGREYNQLRMASASFKELLMAMQNREGRRITANYGMHPHLGKYHRSHCPRCNIITSNSHPIFACEVCGQEMVAGVWDRIISIKDNDESHQPIGRPSYNYRVPPSFIPGLGPKTYTKLRRAIGSEIEIYERAGLDLIEKVAGAGIAGYIGAMRQNRLTFVPGGGGRYGRVKKDNHNI